MVEEMDSRLKRCPCCGGETVLGSLYGCRPWVTYWLPRYRSLLSPFFSRRNIEKSGGFLLAKGREYWYRTPPAPNQSYYCPNCKLSFITFISCFTLDQCCKKCHIIIRC